MLEPPEEADDPFCSEPSFRFDSSRFDSSRFDSLASEDDRPREPPPRDNPFPADPLLPLPEPALRPEAPRSFDEEPFPFPDFELDFAIDRHLHSGAGRSETAPTSTAEVRAGLAQRVMAV